MAKRGRPRKDEGTVWVDGNILWFRLSVDLPDGKKLWTKHSTGIRVGKTAREKEFNRQRADAKRRQAQEALKAQREGQEVAGADLTVAQLARRRFQDRKLMGVETAAKEYQRIRDYLVPEIGQMAVFEVKARHLEAAYRSITHSTYKRGKLLSQKVISELHRDVMGLFKHAISLEVYQGTNPAETVKSFYLRSSAEVDSSEDRPSYTVDELCLIVRDPELEHFWRTFFALLSLGMLRVGEGCALRVRDYDPTKEDLNRPVGERALGELKIARTGMKKKTKTGVRRFVPVHPVAAELLRHHLDFSLPELYGRPVTPDDLLFPIRRTRGKNKGQLVRMRSKDALEVLQEEVLPRLGLPIRHQHAMRRAGSAAMGDAGVSKADRRCVTHAPDFSDMQDRYDNPGWARLSEAVLKIRWPEQQRARPRPQLVAAPAVTSSSSIETASEFLPAFCRVPSERSEMPTEMQRGVGDLNPHRTEGGTRKNREATGTSGNEPFEHPAWFQPPSGTTEKDAPAKTPKKAGPGQLTLMHIGLLAIIRDDGPMTNEELLDLTGLPRTTLVMKVADLRKMGLIEEAGKVQQSQRGGPAAGIWKAVG